MRLICALRNQHDSKKCGTDGNRCSALERVRPLPGTPPGRTGALQRTNHPVDSKSEVSVCLIRDSSGDPIYEESNRTTQVG